DNAGIVLLLCMRSSSSRSDTAGTRGSGWKTGMGRSAADEPQAPRAAPAVEVDGSDQNGPDGDQLVERREADDDEAVLEEHGEERPGEDTGDRHASTEEARPPDHARRDRGEGVGLV